MLAEAFVCKEEKHLIFLDRSAKAGAKIVALERRLPRCSRGCEDRIEKVACIKSIVSEKLKKFAMILIGARASSEIDDRPCVPSVLRRKSRIVNLVFRQRVDRWLKSDLVLYVVVQ